MATTSRWALEYQALGDEPNGAALGQNLAEDTDAALGRALPTANAASRAALVATLDNDDRGLWILQEDTDALYNWTGATLAGPFSPGGGGGSSGGGRWSAGSTAQSVPNTSSGPGTIVAFGTEVTPPSPAQVTRTTEGTGHKFELLASGVWACSATVRVQSAATAGEISVGIWADLDGVGGFNHNVAHDGARREGLARTLNPVATTYLPSGCELVVYVFNGTGTTRTLEPNNGAWVHLDLWLVG